MSQTAVVTRLGVRELWLSFRVLVLLVSFIGAGALVALVPAGPRDTFTRLAQGLAVATFICAGTTGWSVSAERTGGRSGWLVTRSVPRATLVVAWFGSVTLVVLPAVATAGVLGWLSAPAAAVGVHVAAYVVAIGAVTAGATAATALGMLVGMFLRPVHAALVATTLAAGVGVVAWAVPAVAPLVSGGGYVALANLGQGVGTIALRDAGIALVTTGVLLGLARVALSRAEL